MRKRTLPPAHWRPRHPGRLRRACRGAGRIRCHSVPSKCGNARQDWPASDGLILPGGESTTILKFLERSSFFDRLKDFAATRPVFGTCAGAILLAREVRNPAQRSLGRARRDRRTQRLRPPDRLHPFLPSRNLLPGDPLEMVFIRAPRIVATGPDVEVLAPP